jgi:hypothetical protein
MCTPPFSGVLVVPDTVPDSLSPCQVLAAGPVDTARLLVGEVARQFREQVQALVGLERGVVQPLVEAPAG